MSSKAISNIKKWLADPVSFVVDNFKVQPDDWQIDVLIAFNKNQRIGMLASKGVGKTTILSWLCWYFLATRLHPKIAATSISADNLSDGLWAEMSKWQQKSDFLKSQFEWTKTRIFLKDYPETWWMSARTWPKGASNDQQANTLAGLHADNIMFVLDESGGIPSSVMAAAEAALANDMGHGTDAKLVQAGNPTHLSGPLYAAWGKERRLWHITEINSDPDNPKRSPRVSIQWAKDQIEKFGRDNPWVLVNVFGRFPPSSLNVLLGYEEVEEAMKRKLFADDYQLSQKRLGIDVARFGDDSTIIFPRQGLQAHRWVTMRNARNHEISSRIILAKFRWNSEMEYVDGTGGFGAGVVDNLVQKGHNPQEIHFSGKADDPKYFNKRAEMWFRMAGWIKRGGSLPQDDQLLRELTAPEYYFKGDKLILEDKDIIKEKLGFSPDIADALALTFADEERPTGLGELGILNRVEEARGQATTDYDPLDPKRF